VGDKCWSDAIGGMPWSGFERTIVIDETGISLEFLV
jgi:hypothetical protein